jgi:hypothetical protein
MVLALLALDPATRDIPVIALVPTDLPCYDLDLLRAKGHLDLQPVVTTTRLLEIEVRVPAPLPA